MAKTIEATLYNRFTGEELISGKMDRAESAVIEIQLPGVCWYDSGYRIENIGLAQYEPDRLQRSLSKLLSDLLLTEDKPEVKEGPVEVTVSNGGTHTEDVPADIGSGK